MRGCYTQANIITSINTMNKEELMRRAIVLSMESVFSVLGGALLLGERMSWRGYLGCALMLAAVILSQLSSMKKGAADV